MSSGKRTQDISAKQVVSGGILFGLMTLPVLAFACDLPNLHSDAHVFDHYWIYCAISIIGCILAWAIPNSMAVWGNDKGARARTGTVAFIFTGTSGVLYNLVQNDPRGAMIAILITTVFIALEFSIISVWRRFQRKHRA
jgi:predicted permease